MEFLHENRYPDIEDWRSRRSKLLHISIDYTATSAPAEALSHY